MNNRLGNRLNRLIKERAYLGGAIGLLTTELASIKVLADTKASKLVKASARLDELIRSPIRLALHRALLIRSHRSYQHWGVTWEQLKAFGDDAFMADFIKRFFRRQRECSEDANLVRRVHLRADCHC
jgi:hypothetical protein